MADTKDELSLSFSLRLAAKGDPVRSLTKPIAFLLVAIGVLALVLALLNLPELKNSFWESGMHSHGFNRQAPAPFVPNILVRVADPKRLKAHAHVLEDIRVDRERHVERMCGRFPAAANNL
jgi:hypothetical protein